MDINLYTFSKRIKSTLTPTGSGTVVTGSIKEQSSIVHFDVSIDFGPTTSPHVYNYAYVATYNRYYWASDWAFNPETGFWTCSFTVDPYASAKADILAASAYVLYDSHSQYDIPDARIPTSKDIHVNVNSVAFPYTLDLTGRYLLTVVNSNGVEWYIMDAATLGDFLTDLSHWIDNLFNGYTPEWTYLNDAIKSLVNLFLIPFKQWTSSGSVMDNVKNCIWLPLPTPAQFTQTIKVGQYVSNQTAGPAVFNGPVTRDVTVSIPWQFSDWRNMAAYTSVYIYLPFVGQQALNADNLIGISTLNIRLSLDPLTGDLAYIVKAAGNVLGTFKTNIAVQLPIGSMSMGSAGGITTGAIAGITSAVKLLGSQSPAGILAGGALGALVGKAKTTNATVIGNLTGNSALGIDTDIKCIVEYNNTVYNPHDISEIQGEPRNRVMRIGDLSGYVQTSGAQVAGAWTDQELEMINSGLDGGLYIE